MLFPQLIKFAVQSHDPASVYTIYDTANLVNSRYAYLYVGE